MSTGRIKAVLVTLTAVFWMSCAGVVHAQSMNAGDISGVVRDTSGAALPDVTVTVLNKGTGVSKNITTNSDGLYDTSSIVPGTYELTFEKTGFQKLVRSNLTVSAKNISLDVQLSVSQLSTTVEVVAVAGGASEINTQTAEISQIVTPDQVENQRVTD